MRSLIVVVGRLQACTVLRETASNPRTHLPTFMHSDEQAIRDLISAWLSASRTGDRDTVLSLMSEDVAFLLPGQAPMRGRAAFAAAQEGMAGFQIDALADIREIKVFGDWAYCWNHLTVTVTPPDGTAAKRAGDVLSILRKDNGRWAIFRDANLLAATKD
jgi:uncharacterized protein (TIGR02246 family)